MPHPTVKKWLTYLDQRGKSPATCQTYRRGVEHFIRWSEQSYGQPFDPAAIIPRDVADWKAHQQRVERAAPNSINTRLLAVSRYFDWAVGRELARSNPAADISGLPPPARRPKALSSGATRRLLRQLYKSGSRRDIALVELLLGTGLRVSEALALRSGDLILSERSGQVVVRHGKGASHRTVPLTLPVRKALADYLANDPLMQRYLADHPELGPDAALWIGERGPLTDRSGIFYMLKKYARQAGLEPDLLSAHVLRHTFATRYLEVHPQDLRGLAALLGHASLDTVMIYTEPTTEELTDRLEAVEHDPQASRMRG